MKKLFLLVMALCLLAGLMTVTAAAEATAVSVKFENSTAADFTVTVEPGATAYVTSDDAKQFIKWTDAENAPTDKFVKLELSADEITPDSTFESLGIDSLDIVEMIMDLESELGVELEMEDQKISTFGELADFIEAKLN